MPGTKLITAHALFIPNDRPEGQVILLYPFWGEERATERQNNLVEITQQANGGAGIQSHTAWFQKLSEHLTTIYSIVWACQVALVVKNPPANAGDTTRPSFDPWVGTVPWRRAWQPIPVFLPGQSQGQRSLVGYSSWGCKESGTTEAT